MMQAGRSVSFNLHHKKETDMRRTILAFLLIGGSLLLGGCNDSAATNTSAKPANASNSTNAAAPATVDKAAVEAEVRKVMDVGAAALAKNDADTMEKIYADNYMLVNIDGSVQNKTERVAALKSGDPKYSAFSYSDVNIRLKPEGDAAIVIAKLTMKGTFHGKPMDGDYRVTHVYVKNKDGWQQVTAQATKIEAGSEPAKTDEKAAANKSAANK